LKRKSFIHIAVHLQGLERVLNCNKQDMDSARKSFTAARAELERIQESAALGSEEVGFNEDMNRICMAPMPPRPVPVTSQLLRAVPFMQLLHK
jgi:hypothetical protein